MGITIDPYIRKLTQLLMQRRVFLNKTSFCRKTKRTICVMRFVLVVGVLIWSSVIVVSEESIETSSEEFPELQVFNDTMDMESELEPSSLELALTKSGKSSYLRYEGFEIGCYNKLCFRRKWKTSSRLGYMEDWDYKPGGKNKQYVPCKD